MPPPIKPSPPPGATRYLLTPNERLVAEDRPDSDWLYVVIDYATNPVLRNPVPNPAQRPRVEAREVQRYHLDVEALNGQRG